jgi:hypothetical protein
VLRGGNHGYKKQACFRLLHGDSTVSTSAHHFSLCNRTRGRGCRSDPQSPAAPDAEASRAFGDSFFWLFSSRA